MVELIGARTPGSAGHSITLGSDYCSSTELAAKTFAQNKSLTSTNAAMADNAAFRYPLKRIAQRAKGTANSERRRHQTHSETPAENAVCAFERTDFRILKLPILARGSEL